eukprot:TRINITY_DN4161_c0_g1_i1.p1 TRINITY_DN4161_c0_g1~~TRINITY_DN4161_c0_g1_i1.p1  ORF type:complete len:1000 (+),score=204.15 TRINITY_DN4161_c0_g1_i1:24-3002(+)
MRSIQGTLQAKGTTLTNKKWADMFFIVKDAYLCIYPVGYDENRLPDFLFTMHHLTVGDSDKVDQAHPCSLLVKSVRDKKLKFYIGFENEEAMVQWREVIEVNIRYTDSALFKRRLYDACLKDNRLVPNMIKDLIMNIETHISSEGLFRIPGNQNRVDEVVSKVDRDEHVEWASVDVNVLCGLLKFYFRELEEAIIPNNISMAFIDIMVNGQIDRIAKIRESMHNLPEQNYAVLTYLITFLKEVITHSEENKMGLDNIAMVFGPSILRTVNDDLISISCGNDFTRLLINSFDSIFTGEYRSLWDKSLFDIEAYQEEEKYYCSRPCFERMQEVIPDLSSKKYIIRRVFQKEESGLTEKLICVSNSTFYLFNQDGTKKELQSHLLDIFVRCPSKKQLTINVESVRPIELNFTALSNISYDIDAIVMAIYQNLRTSHPDLPTDVHFPPDMNRNEYWEAFTESKNQRCGAILPCYLSVCDYLNVEVNVELVYDLKNVIGKNNFKTLNFVELIENPKYPNSEFLALMSALRFNSWFTELIFENIELGNEGLAYISEMLKTNTTIKKLNLKNTGITKRGISLLCDSIASNNSCKINDLDLSSNNLEDKGLKALSEVIPTSLRHLKHLNLGNTHGKSPGCNKLLKSLEAVKKSLISLDISQFKVDNETCRSLGDFLSVTQSLRYLSLEGCQINFLHIGGFEQNLTLRAINLKDNQFSSDKQKEDLNFFLSHLPNLSDINVSNIGLNIDFLMNLFASHSKITALDISNNEMGEAAFQELFTHLNESMCAITELNISGCLVTKKNKISGALGYLSTYLNKFSSVRKLVIKGTGKSEFHEEILPFIYSLEDNHMLEYLDISGHKVGYQLSECLRRVLQQNSTLSSLAFDENDIPHEGFKQIQIGISKNYSLTSFSIPILNISNIIKDYLLHHHSTPPILEVIRSIEMSVEHNVQKRISLNKEDSSERAKTNPIARSLHGSGKKYATTPKKRKKSPSSMRRKKA